MAAFWPSAALVALLGGGCATQADNGDAPDGAGAASSAGGSTAGSAGGNAGGSSAGSSKGGSSSASGSSNGGSSNAGTGSDDGGSAGTTTGGMGGASAGSGTGGSAGNAGSAGKGGTAGSAGSAGAGGQGGAGGSAGSPQVDACKNGKLDANEADTDCGGVCATKCATGKMCDSMDDCALTNVCDADKCRAQGCNASNCAFSLTRFVIASSAVHGQAFVSWDSDSIDFDIEIFDASPQDDSADNWEDDSVEIYLDLNHSNGGAYDADDFQITVPRANTALSGVGAYDKNAVVVQRSSDAMGYTLEVSIPWSALNGATSKVGSTIGFDLGVNDDTDGDSRNAQLMLYGNDQNYNHSSDFGDLTLTP